MQLIVNVRVHTTLQLNNLTMPDRMNDLKPLFLPPKVVNKDTSIIV